MRTGITTQFAAAENGKFTGSVRKLMGNISPFNNRQEMSKAEFIVKKLLAFVLVYAVSALVGEGIVIGILSAMGYDVLHGHMPEDPQVMMLLSFFGYAFFIIIAIVYCRIFEKRGVKSLGFTGKIYDWFIGGALAVLLLAFTIALCCVTGTMSVAGIGMGAGMKLVLLYALAYLIQGSMEEVFMRGFLMNSLRSKVSDVTAVAVSATVFVVMHLIGCPIFELGFLGAAVSIINLYLISVVFSMLILGRKNLWISCGLHSVWNFTLDTVMGLNVSGGDSIDNGIVNINVDRLNLINGADYGIEAGLACTAVLAVTAFILIWRYKINERQG